jgi:hypothetical protein
MPDLMTAHTKTGHLKVMEEPAEKTDGSKGLTLFIPLESCFRSLLSPLI